MKLTEWNALAKGEEGEETRVVDMKSASIVLHPTWATGPRWELPHRPDPVVVKVPAVAHKRLSDWKTALILPDPQIGFRRDLYTGELDPFHDRVALAVALQIAAFVRPDVVVWLGDVLDFASFSNKFQQEAGFALTVQATLDEAYMYIAKFAAYAGSSRYLEGNHDIRLQNAIIDNAKAAFGLKRAGAPPAEWPVNSVPFLLNLDALNVEYIGGYPAGATYLNDNLACVHAPARMGNVKVSDAAATVDVERVSVIFGHTHRISTAYRTRNSRGAPKFNVAHSPGTLARIDGAVPSTKGAINAFGRPARHYEDWQQSVTLVRYEEGDGRFAIENIPIFNGFARHQGLEFVA